MASGYQYNYSNPYAWADSANVEYTTDNEYKTLAQSQYDAEEAKQNTIRANETYKYDKNMSQAEAQGRNDKRASKEANVESSAGKSGRAAQQQRQITNSTMGAVSDQLAKRSQMNNEIDAGLAQTEATLIGQAKAASEKERERLSNMMNQSKMMEDQRIAAETAADAANNPPSGGGGPGVTINLGDNGGQGNTGTTTSSDGPLYTDKWGNTAYHDDGGYYYYNDNGTKRYNPFFSGVEPLDPFISGPIVD